MRNTSCRLIRPSPKPRSLVMLRHSGVPFWSAMPAAAMIGVEIFLGLVVDRHLVVLAAFFMQPHPPALALLVIILDVHPHDGRDAREAVDHHGDQRAVAQARQFSSCRWNPAAAALPPASAPASCLF